MAQTLKEYLDEKLKSDSLRAPDRNPLVAPQADLAKKVKALLNKYETKKLAADKYPDSPWNRYGAGHSFGDLLFGESPELLDDMSYGYNPLTAGKTGRIPTPDKRLLDMPVPIPATGGLGVIKNKGGNWLTGSVENALKGLKRGNQTAIDDAGQYGGFDAAVATSNQKYHPINSWIDNTLTKYVKNRMATPDDEVRKLADQGILHVDGDNLANYLSTNVVRKNRESAGFHPDGTRSNINRLSGLWEDASDAAIPVQTAGYLTSEHIVGGPKHGSYPNIETDPWLTKLDPKEPIYRLPKNGDVEYALGFDHLIDELLNATNPESGLPMNLRMKPEGFKGLSMEEAVKKVHGINAFRAEQAKKVNERFAQAEGIPVYKDYGDGTRLLEYKLPDELPKGTEVGRDGGFKLNQDYYETADEVKKKQLESWLKQEGDTMGHCVGGYCDAVTSGQSRILSLRDKDGKSRATIELRPSKSVLEEANDGFELMDLLGLPQKYAEEYYINLGNHSGNKYDMLDHIAGYYPEVYSQIKSKLDQPLKTSIHQIKGPGNRAPDPDVLPYLQDFVKSGDWSDVSDLQNTGLRDVLKPSGRTQSDNDELLNIIGSRFATDDQINKGMEQLRKLRIKKMFDEQE